MMELSNNKTNYSDPDFPHTFQSISTSDKHAEWNATTDWYRPDEFMVCGYDKIKLFDAIQPDDIMQGELGVCYFLATLSCGAEF